MALRLFVAAFAAALVLVIAIGGSPGTVSAHERRVVAENYEFEVGFLVEPAVANNLNGVFMSIAFYPAGAPETAGGEEAEGAEGEPVEGADQSLSVTVAVGGGAATKELEFESLEIPGTYYAAFIPTVAGDYTFVITGTLDGTEIDETFESGPNTFEPVEDPADLEFPAPTDAGDSSASESSNDDDSDTAMIIAVIGVILAVLAGGVAIFAVSRSRSA